MGKTIKSVTDPGISLNVLSNEDVRQIHEATLEVIETVGIRFPSERALDIWEAHGAQVDRESKIVKVPSQVIEEAMKEVKII